MKKLTMPIEDLLAILTERYRALPPEHREEVRKKHYLAVWILNIYQPGDRVRPGSRLDLEAMYADMGA